MSNNMFQQQGKQQMERGNLEILRRAKKEILSLHLEKETNNQKKIQRKTSYSKTLSEKHASVLIIQQM